MIRGFTCTIRRDLKSWLGPSLTRLAPLPEEKLATRTVY